MALRRALRPSIGALLLAGIAVSGVFAGDAATALLGLPAIVVPADNPITAEKIALGEKLFFDRRLSKNGTLSCAMCHIPEQGFTQNELATSVGFEGKSLRRNAPSLLNVALHNSFQRDGAKSSLEAQVWGPLLAADEMANGTIDNVVERVNALPDYQQLIEPACAKQQADERCISYSLATYERTLLAGGSRFDEWFFGADERALSEQEKAGYRFFVAAGCSGCHLIGEHDAPLTDNQFHDTGISAFARQNKRDSLSVQLAPGVTIQIERDLLANVSAAEEADAGRFEVTGQVSDRDAFKTPTLRNVALTAPYMHDGSLASLEQVVDWYAQRSSTRGLIWTGEEKVSLRAFLAALTSRALPQINH